MGSELEALRKQVKLLEHDNNNLKARERHMDVTSGRGPKGGVASEADKKKMDDLMGTVEQLQTEKAVSLRIMVHCSEASL